MTRSQSDNILRRVTDQLTRIADSLDKPTTPETSDMDRAIKKLWDAIYDDGNFPPCHQGRISQLKQQWPTLWNAIDAILDASE